MVMNPTALLSLFAAALSIGLAVYVLAKDRKSLSNRTFFAGMLLLAAQEIIAAIEADGLFRSEVLWWHRIRWTLDAYVPGVWLLFSLSFARSNYRDFLRRWRWILVAVFVVPSLLISIGRNALLIDAVLEEAGGWRLPIGWAGFALQLFSLLISILILMNLEGTLRASTGARRWRIKFTLLGVGAILAVRIYLSSQTLLYSSTYTPLLTISSATLILSALLIAVSLWRSRDIRFDLYLSVTAVYRSLTLLIVGIYLLAVGFVAQGVLAFGGSQSLPAATFIVFVALTVLAVGLLSDEGRIKFRAFIYRHLKRPRYDHREVWRSFTRHIGSDLDIESLSAAMVKFTAETFDVSSASLWLLSDAGDELNLELRPRFRESALTSGSGVRRTESYSSSSCEVTKIRGTSTLSELSSVVGEGVRRRMRCVR